MMKFSPSLALRASRAEMWNPGRDAFFINGEAWSSDGEALRLGGGVLSVDSEVLGVMKAAGSHVLQARKPFAFRRVGAVSPA